MPPAALPCKGSLRDIQLRRNGQTISHFDLYDLLILGDMSKDSPLLPGDVIYIPPVGAQVAIAGDVHIPAIYELKGDTTVEQALRFAGGTFRHRITAAGIAGASECGKEPHRLDIPLQGAGLATPLQQADILRVLPISPQFQNTVTLRGNVAETGRFSWHPGMRLSDIIPDSQSLITRDYWERRNQLGVPGPEFKPEYANNPDYYPRDLNGYQTGTAQYDVNGVPIYNGQPAPNLSQGQQANGSRTNGANITQSNNQNANRFRDKTTIRTVSPTPAVFRSKISTARPLDPLPREPTPRTGNRAQLPAADRWPMRPRRPREIFPGRLLRSLFPCRRSIGPTQ